MSGACIGDGLDVSDTARPAVRVFELVAGSEFAAFFASGESDLPSDGVRRELRVLARSGHGVATRGIGAALISDGIAGIVGTGAWLTLAASFTATSRWLQRIGQRGKVADVPTVVARLREASEEILGSAPRTFDAADIHRQDDGHWQAQFSYRDFDVTASVDQTGSVVTWVQVPTGRATSALD